MQLRRPQVRARNIKPPRCCIIKVAARLKLHLGQRRALPEPRPGIDLIHRLHRNLEIRCESLARSRHRLKHRRIHIPAQQHRARNLRANDRFLLRAAEPLPRDRLRILAAPDAQRISRLQSIHAPLNREERSRAARARIRVEALLVHKELRGVQSGGKEDEEQGEFHGIE